MHEGKEKRKERTEKRKEGIGVSDRAGDRKKKRPLLRPERVVARVWV